MKYSLYSLKERAHHYPLKKFFIHFILGIILLVVLGYIYRLKSSMICLLCIEILFLLPWFIRSYDRYLYEKKRFDDVVNYLETMLYSFKKRPKIINALEDSYELSTGMMKDLIQKTHQNLMDGQSNDYTTLFNEIELHYACRRMKEIHLFLIDIELLGGDYLEQVDLLLEDLANWNEHIFHVQKERELIKKRILLSIVLSMLIMASSLMMVPRSMDITHIALYQWATSFVVAVFLFLYVFIQTRLQYAWLDEIDEEKQDRLLEKQTQFQKQGFHKIEKIMTSCLAGILFIAFYKRQWLLIIVCIGLLFLVLNMRKWQKERFNRAYRREIEIVFPIWLRSMGLHLQTENVHRSLQHSLSRSPKLLVPHLEKLLFDIESDPKSMLPYVHFLEEYS